MKYILVSAVLCLLSVASVSAQSLSEQNTANPQQSDAQRKRLVELNRLLNELDQRIDQLKTDKQAAEDERRRLLVEIARDEAEREFKGGRSFVVVKIESDMTVRLLMHGVEQSFHLFGYYVPLKNSERGIAFLKHELESGVAYVRCEDAECHWGYLYSNPDDVSINSKIVKEGIGFANSPTSLDEKQNTFPRRDPGPSPSASSQSPIDAGVRGTPKAIPGTEVQVKGYYRKDGTYVAPHTRSAPHRKP